MQETTTKALNGPIPQELKTPPRLVESIGTVGTKALFQSPSAKARVIKAYHAAISSYTSKQKKMCSALIRHAEITDHTNILFFT